MKKFLFQILTVSSLTSVYSQHLYSEKYGDCVVTSFCLDCGDPKAQPPKSIVDELVHNLDKKSLIKINGTIEVQILIDETGKPCLLSSVNKSNISSKKLGLQKAINSTSSWEPAVSENEKAKSSVSLIISFENGTISVSRRVFDFTNQLNEKSIGTPDAKGTDRNKLSKTWTLFTQEKFGIALGYDKSCWQ